LTRVLFFFVQGQRKRKGIIATYNLNRYDKEKQQALEAWERKLNSIITATASDVIPITRKAA